ncbi:Rv3235 family protein [Pseudonocardia nigra]|uniref:Rv3235 family protein n=1 Tax=Pseudonocardia nigra TaxID=1921578 RepID=UPI001C5CD33B|nr:Rv3235 family protein [Pseudonocardia nigra]
MTSSSGHNRRIRSMAYEPTAEPTPPSRVACPHCGASITIGARNLAPEPSGEAPAALVVDLPDAAAVRVPVARVLRLILEVIDARRPVAQLDEVVAPSVLRYARAARLAGRPARVSRLLSLRVFRPTEHAAEAAAVVAVEQRRRAVAARFEQQQTVWRCVALRIL